MNIPSKTSRSLLLALLFIGHLTPCCWASTAQVMSVEEMIEEADVVLVGNVECIILDRQQQYTGGNRGD